MSYQQQNFSFDFIKRAGQAFQVKCEKNHIKIAPGSEADLTIKKAAELANWWKEKKTIEGLPKKTLARAMCCLRLAPNAIFLEDGPQAKMILRNLCKGSMMYWNNEKSKAKDTEWEVNTWAHLNQTDLEPHFLEPDLQIRIGDRPMGVSCKKLYSWSNVNKQVSKGVRQIEKSNIPGILALSLDCLVQPNLEACYLRAKDMNEARNMLQATLDKFIERKRKWFYQHYFLGSRISGAILSIQVLTVLEKEKGHFFNGQESEVWTAESVSENLRQKVLTVADKMKRSLAQAEIIEEKIKQILGD